MLIGFNVGSLTISCRFQPWCLHCPFPRSDGMMIISHRQSVLRSYLSLIKADFNSSTTSDCSVPATKKCSDLPGRLSLVGKCAQNRPRKKKKKRRRPSGTWSSFARRSPGLWIPSVSSGSSTALTGQSNVPISQWYLY
jgi:hypothetical protein